MLDDHDVNTPPPTGNLSSRDASGAEQVILPEADSGELLGRFPPLQAFLLILVSVGISEISAMVIVYLLLPLPYWKQTLIDVVIMLALVFPVLYLTFLRPVIERVEHYRQTTVALQAAYRELQNLKSIIDYSPAMAIEWETGEEWPVSFVSDNVAQFGYRPEALRTGEVKFLDIIHPGDRERVREEARRYADEGVEQYVQQYRIVTSSGDARWLHDRTWVRQGNGKPDAHHQSIIVDITEQKEAEEQVMRERANLTNILNALRDGVYIVDDQYNVQYANPAVEAEFGPLAGRMCYQYLHNRDSACPWCINDSPPTAGGASYQWEAPSGKTYEFFDMPLESPEGQRLYLKVFHDVTTHRRYEKQLEESNRQLTQLREQERSQRRWAEALVGATATLSHSLDLGETLEHILDQIKTVVPFQAAAVLFGEAEKITLIRHLGFEELPSSLAAVEQGQLSVGTISGLEQIWKADLPILAQDLWHREPRWEVPGFEWARSAIIVPLKVSGEPAGMIALLSDEPDFFRQQDVEHLVSFGDHAAVALQNARLFSREQEARNAAEVLRSASLALAASLDLQAVMKASLDYIRRLIPFDSANVVLLREETYLDMRMTQSDGTGKLIEMTDGEQQLLQALVYLETLIAEKKSMLLPDTTQHPHWRSVPGAGSVKSWLGVPLVVAGEAIGFYGLNKREKNFFTEAHRRVAEAMAAQTAVSLQNAWLFEQVQSGHDRLQSLSRRLVEVRENERQYISRELHDEAGQALIAMLARLRTLEDGADKPEVVLKCVADIEQTVQNVISNLHRVAMALRPVTLDQVGLEAALRATVEDIAAKHPLVVRLESTGQPERLSKTVETILYRIAQEALTNVIRHAEATRVDILLKRRAETVFLMIEDDGIGFNSATLGEGQIGLLGMQERAEMLGGELLIESTPGKGTTLIVEVPDDSSSLNR